MRTRSSSKHLAFDDDTGYSSFTSCDNGCSECIWVLFCIYQLAQRGKQYKHHKRRLCGLFFYGHFLRLSGALCYLPVRLRHSFICLKGSTDLPLCFIAKQKKCPFWFCTWPEIVLVVPSASPVITTSPIFTLISSRW